MPASAPATPAPASNTPRDNFIGRQIDQDLQSGKHPQIITRFPPEPNGYLHIGHAKSIWLNFGIARAYNGKCTLRFDDTNPAREDQTYVAAIKDDIRWLGYQPHTITHASDYFPRLHALAVQLIQKGLAYVDAQSADAVRAQRGTLTEPGTESPHRNRPIPENLALFAQMKNGEIPEGEMVLRARIDMASPNLNLRDPVLYRIRRLPHQRSGDKWCIYPMYDFAHGQSDAIEGVTHSLCTLEFEDHRPLYDWFLENLDFSETKNHAPAPLPRQIEFSRLNLNYTVMSKRLLAQLVENRDVDGWDDPRMPTLCGLRKRGFPPSAINAFIAQVGITRNTQTIDLGALETCARQQLEPTARRFMAVLNPLKIVLTNYPPDKTERIEVPNHPQNPALGTRPITLSREIYIEREDFMETPPNKFFRLAPGREVRLRYAFVIRCTKVIKSPSGEIRELHCHYDPETYAGAPPKTETGEPRKIKGIIHWVNAQDAKPAKVHLIDRLFTTPNPLADKTTDFRTHLNPDSLITRENAKIEDGQLMGLAKDVLTNAKLLEPKIPENEHTLRVQFERLGYFYLDTDNRSFTFNRIVTLRDTWAAITKRAQNPTAQSH